MELWKKTAIGTVIGLAAAYLLFSLIYFRSRRVEPVCKQMVIRFADAKQKQYATPDEIRSFIINSGCNPEGNAISEQHCHEIEQTALLHPMVRTASCYATPAGEVVVRLTQREPRLRVLGAENYYVDSDRRIMQVRSTTAADVPIVTGRVSQRMAQEELFDFVEWLEDDDFWTAQIEQINVVNPERIELIPRIGSGVIVLGSLREFDRKLRKLKVLYREGFSKFGWNNDYKEIDLRFRGQVVCR